MPHFLFPNGTATVTGAYIIVKVLNNNGELFDGNLYADYRYVMHPGGCGTNWSAVSICYKESEKAVYAAGENGEILRITEAGNSEEFIAPPENGPVDQGPLREIRIVGDDLFVVGMGRQVYRRAGEGHWNHYDTGVLDYSGRTTAGLTSIIGYGRGLLIAVGYDGEIWEFRERWTQVSSPTNLLLTRVVAHKGKYFAAGLAGTLLCREPQGWRVIDTAGFAQDVWDLETFGGTLYLGTSQGLFWMTPDDEIKAVDPATFTRQVHCASLSAGYGRLWCFGAEVVSSTADGIVWREEAIF